MNQNASLPAVRRPPRLSAVWHSLRWLAIPGVTLTVVGMFGPWVAHRAVALTVMGIEFGEWTKFLPAVSSGTTHVDRLAFYLPWGIAGIVSAWLAVDVVRPLWLRLLLLLPALVLCLFILPPYPDILTAYRGGEWRPQFLLGSASIAGVVLLGLSGRLLHRQIVAWALGLLILLSALYLWLQARAVWPLILDLYREPVQPGWGLGAVAAGLVLMAVGLAASGL